METNEPRGETPGGETPGNPRADDRRHTVKPNEHPHPSNPPVDEEAVEKGRETLDRVKPY